jgi:hypothetical protein
MMNRSLLRHRCAELRYRVAIGLLMGTVLLLASRHYAAVRRLDRLRAENAAYRLRILAMEDENPYLKTLRGKLYEQNVYRLNKLEMEAERLSDGSDDSRLERFEEGTIRLKATPTLRPFETTVKEIRER